ncbi:uncharacterized protein LOC130995763 [Salvia miltiorrhiza]|uniref:uncharacterized protein LOC130995763 n=1 Tax=Salvia miltiorrhiza TaxID=226208 RepID=UPI0025AB9C48|nr:uncharacterized protein LOC130995763 [Salvia miltiorrhiza]
MAENSPKRHRDDSIESDLDDSSSSAKRQKPYNNILNLLDEEDEPEPSDEPSEELSHDLSAIFTTLQQELSSSSSGSATTDFDFESPPTAAEHSQPPECGGGDEDESVKSVMRHLLEASDDELGIPNTTDENGVENFNAAENLPFAFTDHGLWELEDVAANYYTVLQSELFM